MSDFYFIVCTCLSYTFAANGLQVSSLVLRQGLCNFHDLHLVLYNPLPNRGLWSPRRTQRPLIVFYFSLLAQSVNQVVVRSSSSSKKVRFVLNSFILSVGSSNFICINWAVGLVGLFWFNLNWKGVCRRRDFYLTHFLLKLMVGSRLH